MSSKIEIKPDYNHATGVRFDTETRTVVASFLGIERAIAFDAIPEDDWDSKAPVTGFTITRDGSAILAHHEDGEATWFPADMWEPGGFTPKAVKPRGRGNKAPEGTFAFQLRQHRVAMGVTQEAIAKLIKVSPRTVEQWEQNRSAPASALQDSIWNLLKLRAAPLKSKSA